VEERRSLRPLADLESAAADLAPIRPFTESVVGEEISFVCAARASTNSCSRLRRKPSWPESAAALDPLGTAATLSTMPLLLTDLIVDPYQLYEAGWRAQAAWC